MGIEQIQSAKTRRYCPLFSSIGVKRSQSLVPNQDKRATGLPCCPNIPEGNFTPGTKAQMIPATPTEIVIQTYAGELEGIIVLLNYT
jgi:hypothetical protein